MKGLLYKDITILLGTYKKNMLLVMLLYAGIVWYTRLPYMAFAVVFLWGLYVSSTVSFDEQCHWDTYACTLPLTAAQLVGVKYLLTVLATLAGCVMSVVMLALLPLASAVAKDVSALPDAAECLAGIAVSAGISLGIGMITLPISYRFGGAQSRSWLGAFCIVACFAVVIIKQLLPDAEAEALATRFAGLLAHPALAAGIFFLVLAVLYTASYLICVKIYRQKAL